MPTKPNMIKLIAIIYILAPLIYFLTGKYVFNQNFFAQLSTSSTPTLNIVAYFVIYPVVGVAIFFVKDWSLFLVALGKLAFFTINLDFFSKHEVNSLPYQGMILFIIINIAVVFYLLRPTIRSLFFDKNLRWWEQDTRYLTSIPCKVDFTLDGTILNISVSGALINMENYPEHDTANISFHTSSAKLNTKAKIIRRSLHSCGTVLIGVYFSSLSGAAEVNLKELVTELNTTTKPMR